MIAHSPKRVLHVLEATLGGTRRYVEDLATASDDGTYVNAIAYGTARADAAFHTLLADMRGTGWQTFEIDLRRSIDLRRDFACVARLREIIAEFQPDIIHGHSSKGGAIARLAVAGRRERPAIVYSPNAVAVDLGLQYRIAEHLLSPLTDVFAAISPSERDELIDLRLGSPTAVRVVSPTVRREFFEPRDRPSARTELGLSDAPLVVGIGRLAPQKDPLAFVAIMTALRNLVPAAHGVWVGDGELRGEMEAGIAHAGLGDAVRITGWLTDVRPYLAACDVFLSCAAYESFGYVTAEAFAMERPVVASCITGTVDIVTTDVEHALFAPKDVAGAARLIAAFLADPALASTVARRGRQRVLDAFSAATTRRHLSDAYDAAVAEPAPPATAAPQPRRAEKLASLDAVRALAIFAVVGYHITQMAQPTWHGHPHVFFEIGVWGVDCFFVLSGFLLGGEYLRRLVAPTVALQSTRGFWAKRVLRIVPLYVACVLLSAVLDGTLLHAFPSAGDIASHLLFLHDFSAATATTINGPFWTMPVDLEFYACLPLYALAMAALFRLLPRVPREPLLYASLAAIALAGLAFRFYEARYNPVALRSFADEVVWLRNVVGMSGAFCLGGALALFAMKNRRPNGIACAALLAVAAGCVAIVARTSTLAPGPVTTRLVLGHTIFDFVGAISAALVMYVIVEGNIGFVNRFVNLRAIAEVATLAYGVYLLHYPIAVAVTPLFLHLSSVERVLAIGLATLVPTFVLAYILNRTIERPFLNLKSRIRT